MRERLDKLYYISSTALFGLLALLFVGVLITSLSKNAVDMCVRVGFDWRHTGNYVGLVAGFVAAFVVGCLACRFMIGVVKRGKLIWFAIYCAIVGCVAIGTYIF